MKNIIGLSFCLFLFLGIIACSDSTVENAEAAVIETVESENAPASVAAIAWEKSSHDFGAITQGEPVICEFTLTNSGKEPLIISNVKASCGCTVPSYPKEPIAPGETQVITAKFNAKSAGKFSKTLTVTSNADVPTQRLTLKGEVMGS